MSDHTRSLLDIVFYVALQGVVTVFGCAFNVLNIVVFVKQGFKETVNISFLGLAISDLGALVTLLWMSVCYTPEFRFSEIPFESLDVEYLTACWPHGCFARITSLITAFITLERCLCITLPLKVKEIITAKRTIAANVFIFLLMLCILSPAFYADRFGPVSVSERNKTLIGLVFVENGQFIESICRTMDVGVQLIAFVVVSISTVILIQNLLRNIKWRMSMSKSSTSGSGQDMGNRDKKVVRMVTSISCMFIICFLPTVVNYIVMFIFPSYSIKGPYSNIFRFVWAVLKLLEAVHSSATIFIYFNMSTKYRAVLREVVCVFRQLPAVAARKSTTETTRDKDFTSETLSL
ncbi:hypothetical protein BsWGS_17989 [Bradybaena similaris]